MWLLSVVNAEGNADFCRFIPPSRLVRQRDSETETESESVLEDMKKEPGVWCEKRRNGNTISAQFCGSLQPPNPF